MREEALILLSFGSMNVTAYSLMMAAAALLGTLVTCLVGRKRIGMDRCLSLSLCAFAGAVLGGHVVYCLTNIGMLLADYQSGFAMFWQLNLGGYTLYGALLGGVCGIAVYAAVTGQKVFALTDLAVPGSMLALCIGRAAEMFTNQGLGEYVDEEAGLLLRFPFAIALQYDEDYVEWRVPVFVYEAAVAFVIFLAVLLLIRKVKTEGRLTGTAFTLIGATQIFLEQLRQDDYIRFGFVRFTQLAAILIILAVLVVRVIRSAKVAGWKPALTLRCLILVLGALLVIFVEFCVEKPQFLPVIRIVLLLWAAIIACWLIDRAAAVTKAAGKHNCLIAMSVISLIVVAASVAAMYLLTLELEWENSLLLGVMAAALVSIVFAVECRTDEDRE